jgi:hypothetical protein
MSFGAIRRLDVSTARATLASTLLVRRFTRRKERA